MGAWQLYSLRFSAAAPIHIGYHRLGLIERTRTYIPARSIWGACVAGLTPGIAGDGSEPIPERYAKVQAMVDKVVRFSYLFPADRGEILRPRYLKGGLVYGQSLTASAFEGRYIYSQTSAALAPTRLTAEDGALHESEYLIDRAGRDGTQVEYRGYLMVKDPALIGALRAALGVVHVGSDRKYGWGRLVMDGDSLKPVEDNRVFSEFRFEVGVEGDHPELSSSGEWHVPAHLEAGAGICGELEVFRGREWGPTGSGRKVVSNGVVWTPGSRGGGAGRFCVTTRGLWRMM